MLQELIDTLCEKLGLPRILLENGEGLFVLQDTTVLLKDLKPGVSFFSRICPISDKRQGDLIEYLLEADFFGRGTGGAIISLEKDEKFLTLRESLPYDLKYLEFKEKLEDFINYLLYWKEEIDKFVNQPSPL